MYLFIILSVFEGLNYSITSAGMGGNSVALRECGFHDNQATLAYRKDINLIYTFNREFSVFDVHRANLSWNNIGLGIISRQTPDPESSTNLSGEMEFRLAHGISLSDKFKFGYSLNGYYLWIRNFGSEITMGFDISFLGEIYEDWLIGINAHNINRPKIGMENAYVLPWSISAGVSYNPYPNVSSHLGFTREENYPLQLHLGQRFKLGEQLVLMAGLQNEPIRLSLGIEVNAGWFTFHYSIRNHRRMPLSHWVGVSYR